MLTRFREKHPRIAVELVLSNRTDDLIRRDADIAVRMIRPTQTALIARKTGVVQLGLYAHRRYIEAHGAPAALDELGQHPVIGFDREPSVRRLKELGVTLTRDLFLFRSDSDVAQFMALSAGFGLGMCQYGLAARNPDLVPIMPGLISFDLDIWIVMHEDLKTSRRMRLMFDHLAEEMTAYVRESEAAGKKARGA
jgi:DNA-binding transcriptional LysR family regulator